MVTLFIDNLPKDMTRDWLLQLFEFEGKVADVYLSRKQRRGHKSPFGFVRYRRKVETLRAIKNLNGMIVRNCKIEVTMAKFDRKGQANPVEQNNRTQEKDEEKNKKAKDFNYAFRDNRSYKEVVVGTKSRVPETVIMHGEASKERVSWLERSVIGEISSPIYREEVQKAIGQIGVEVENILSMGMYKFLITFNSKKEAENAANQKQNGLWSFFEEITLWSPEETCQTRRVWIECWGLPIHGWSETNLSKIGEVWGKVVKVDMDMEDLSYARVLVDIALFPLIKRWVCFTLDGTVYDVYVKESNVVHQDIVDVDEHFLIVGNQVQKPTNSKEEDKRSDCMECNMEDEALQAEKKKDIDDREQQLVHSMMHNSQANENVAFYGTEFRWDTELRPQCSEHFGRESNGLFKDMGQTRQAQYAYSQWDAEESHNGSDSIDLEVPPGFENLMNGLEENVQ